MAPLAQLLILRKTPFFEKLLRSQSNRSAVNQSGNTNLQPDFDPIDVSVLNHPGIYEILDIQYDGLMNESHESKALVIAFKQQNKQIENFRFRVLKSGPEWADREVRLEYEEMLI